jgi:hypothetical protein
VVLEGELGASERFVLWLDAASQTLRGRWLRLERKSSKLLEPPRTLTGTRTEAGFALQQEGVPAAQRVELVLADDGTASGSLRGGAAPEVAFTARPKLLSRAAEGFESMLGGKLNGNKAIRARLAVRSGKLTGQYRYGDASQDLELSGHVEPSGAAALEERNEAGAVTGRWRGLFLHGGHFVGDWSSPDGARSYPLELDHSSDYPPITRIDAKLRIYPVHLTRQSSNCTSEALFPRLLGLADKAFEKSVNAELYRLSGGAEAETFCENAPESGDPEAWNDQPWNSSHSYDVTGKRAGLVGLRFGTSAFSGGVHDYHSSTCRILEAATGRLFTLGERLLPVRLPDFEKLVQRTLARQPDVQRMVAEGIPVVDAVHVTSDSDLCLTDDGLFVYFGDYALGGYALGHFKAELSAAEVRPFFDKQTAAALFR